MTAELRSPARPRSPARRRWLGPVGLILMSVIPIAGGAALLTELARGAHVTPANARFFAEPLPVAVHIVCASTYILLGPLQFIPGFRRRLPGWHRIAGRVLIPAGILAALAGLWMVVYYPLAPGDDELLRYVRLVFGSALAGSLVLGYIAIRHRDFAAHRAWMIRGYAVAQGAGTQALIGIPWLLIAGQPRRVPAPDPDADGRLGHQRRRRRADHPKAGSRAAWASSSSSHIATVCAVVSVAAVFGSSNAAW